MIRKIFVVDDHDLVRSGFRHLFEGEPDLSVCGAAADTTSALAEIAEADPDLVITDISMEGPSGIELVKHLAARHPDLPVLVVSMHDEALYAERALRAGARGHVMKSEMHETIVEAVRQILKGGLYLSSGMNSRMLLQYVSRDGGNGEASPVEGLTDRELETFELLGRGYSTREAAEAMHISPKTIGTYRRRIKEKLALAGRSRPQSRRAHQAPPVFRQLRWISGLYGAGVHGYGGSTSRRSPRREVG